MPRDAYLSSYPDVVSAMERAHGPDRIVDDAQVSAPAGAKATASRPLRALRRAAGVLCLLAVLAFAAVLVLERVLEHRLAGALRDHAAALGLDLEFATIDVDLDGEVALTDVVVGGPGFRDVRMASLRADIDLARAIDGQLHFQRVQLDRPVIQLSEAQLEQLCGALSLCRRDRPQRGAVADSDNGWEALFDSPTSPRIRPATSAAWFGKLPSGHPEARDPLAFDRLDVRGLQLEVSGHFLGEDRLVLALYQLDLRVERLPGQTDRHHISGSGRLLSFLTEDRSVAFELDGELSAPRRHLGVEVDMGRALAFDTPAATLSFERLGVDLGAADNLWVGDVVVLPDLVNFTDAWRAESITASLSLRRGFLPDRILVEGLKGELDLVTFSDFVAWLVEEPEAPGTVGGGELADEMGALREEILRSVDGFRASLYGLSGQLEGSLGDVRLRYGDGSTLDVSDFRLDLDANRRSPSPSLRFSYQGKRRFASQGGGGGDAGSVRLGVGDLSAEQLLEWLDDG